MSVRLGFLSGRRPSHCPSDRRDVAGDDLTGVWVLAGFWLGSAFLIAGLVLREVWLENRERAREDAEVAALDALFELDAVEPWRRWVG